MQTISVREMRNQLGKLDKLIAREKEIIVTRYNKPLARILPVKGKKKDRIIGLCVIVCRTRR